MKELVKTKTVYESITGRTFEDKESCIRDEKMFVINKMRDEVAMRISPEQKFYYQEIASPYLKNGVDVLVSICQDSNRIQDIIRVINSIKNEYKDI